MKTYRILILLGLVFFVASFFLVAVREAGATQSAAGIRGYTCAYAALLAPWGSDGLRMLRQGPVDYFSILFSGWINPLFLIAVVPLLVRPRGRFAAVLRIILLIMFVAPWIVFYKEHLHPREGYFLWTAAMLLALFSSYIGAGRAEKAVDNRSNLP